ncbi:WD40 repeat-like protein [Cyathus striatus]|nr:WD40 repeat-like protein [Cyathus striatus]
MADEQFQLPSPPFDSISSVKYSPTHPDQLIVSSWDTTVRFYAPTSPSSPSQLEQKTKFDHRAAVLSCTFDDTGKKAYSGGLDAVVRELDLETEGSVSGMVWSREKNALISGSWDRTLRFFDPRSSSSAVPSYTTPERVYAMDLVNNTLVVAMASRIFSIYDIRKMDAPTQQRESSLKYMTRSVACMPDGEGYATASVEGRIAVEYFDPSPAAQDKKYAFKCHRQTIEDVDHVWPVNALVFHPIYSTFASAGSDGTVSIWDHKVKKRLRQYPRYSAPVSSLSFSCDGSKLAVGVSYTWDEGEQGLKNAPQPAVYIRKVGDEVKPKGWTGN